MRKLSINQIPLTEEYTYLVDSDEALAAWANNAGDNFTHVHIAAGTYTLHSGLNGGTPAAPAAAIDLTVTNTRRITGEAGSKLRFLNAGIGFFCGIKGPVTGSAPDFSWPDNNSGDYSISGVTVEAISEMMVDNNAIAFSHCANLTNCTGSARGTMAFGFYCCANLSGMILYSTLHRMRPL